MWIISHLMVKYIKTVKYLYICLWRIVKAKNCFLSALRKSLVMLYCVSKPDNMVPESGVKESFIVYWHFSWMIYISVTVMMVNYYSLYKLVHKHNHGQTACFWTLGENQVIWVNLRSHGRTCKLHKEKAWTAPTGIWTQYYFLWGDSPF